MKPLSQAADSIVAAAPSPVRPLTPVARARLLEEILDRGGYSGRLRLLVRARDTAGGLDFIAAAFRQFSLLNHDPEELLDLADEMREPRVTELARAYKDYCVEMRRHNLMDREARLGYACRLCESGKLPRGRFNFVVVSGLDSLAPLEWRFVRAVLANAERSCVALTVGAPPALEEAEDPSTPTPYLLPAELARRLTTLYPDAEVRWLASDLPAGDLRRQAVQRLFRDPRHMPPPPTASHEQTLVLHAAKGLQQEAEATAYEVKRLLLAGAQPEEIVVATRRIGEWSARVSEAFSQAGVPLAVEGALTLGAAPLARAAALLLRLAADDWTHDAVHSAVTLPGLGLFDAPLDENEWRVARQLGVGGRRAAVEWVINELLYPKGRRALLDRVAWLAASRQEASAESEDETIDRRRDKLAAAASLALPPLQRLADVTQSLLPEADPLTWHDRLTAALHALKYRAPAAGETASPTAERDTAAVAAMEEAFASLARLAAWRGGEQRALSLEEVARLMRGWLSRVQLDIRWDSEGRVRLLTAETAGETPCQHLLLIGLDEQSFPRADAGLTLDSGDAQQRRHQSGEMLLFCKLLTTAHQSVRLSYAALDDKAQSLNPSSYVAELERVLPPGCLRVEGSADAAPLDTRQLRRLAVQQLMEGDNACLARLLAVRSQGHAAQALAAGLLAGHDRRHGEHFGAYEGVLGSEAAQGFTLARFGPEHLWSASQLELYGTCPFKFFMRHVLHADPVESLALDVDYRRRGSLLHDAMVRFHRRVNELVDQGAATSTLDADAFAAAFGQAINEAFESLATAPHEAAVAEVEALQATAWSEEYRRQHERYDKLAKAFEEPLIPAHFEARFGPLVTASDEPQDPLSTSEPYSLQAGDYQVLLTGQVDRIDVGRVAGQKVFSIIDYKTSRSLTLRQEDIESGRLLQLVLYTLAVSDHLFAGQAVAPWRSGYWAVQNDGFKTGKLPQPGETADGRVTLAEDWDELVGAVRTRVGEIVRDVRAARFPMFNIDEDCGGRCEYRTVCRVAQARSLGKLPGGPPLAGAP